MQHPAASELSLHCLLRSLVADSRHLYVVFTTLHLLAQVSQNSIDVKQIPVCWSYNDHIRN